MVKLTLAVTYVEYPNCYIFYLDHYCVNDSNSTCDYEPNRIKIEIVDKEWVYDMVRKTVDENKYGYIVYQNRELCHKMEIKETDIVSKSVVDLLQELYEDMVGDDRERFLWEYILASKKEKNDIVDIVSHLV